MKILLAYDGSSHADKALQRAAMIAEKSGAEVTVISVAPDLCLPTTELSEGDCENVISAFAREAEGTLKKAGELLSAKGVAAKLMSVSGESADKIVEAAETLGADMIVVGSRGRQGAKRLFLGSVSGKVAELARCDVLIVK